MCTFGAPDVAHSLTFDPDAVTRRNSYEVTTTVDATNSTLLLLLLNNNVVPEFDEMHSIRCQTYLQTHNMHITTPYIV